MREGAINRSGGNGRSSTCVTYGGCLYISGIATVHLEADILGQSEDVLGQIDKLLAHYKTDKNNVLSATVYLKNIEDYGDFNSVWDQWVTDGHEPTRTLVAAKMTLPEYLVMVSVVAALDE